MFAIDIAFGASTSREEKTLRAAGLGMGELLADADSVPAVAARQGEAGRASKQAQSVEAWAKVLAGSCVLGNKRPIFSNGCTYRKGTDTADH